jgi:hypothetical protein
LHAREATDNRLLRKENAHNHRTNSESEDYESERVRVSYLLSLFIVLEGFRGAGHRYLGFHTEDLSSGVTDV